MDAAASRLLSQQGADAIVTAEGIADADHQAGVLGTGGHGQGGGRLSVAMAGLELLMIRMRGTHFRDSASGIQEVFKAFATS